MHLAEPEEAEAPDAAVGLAVVAVGRRDEAGRVGVHGHAVERPAGTGAVQAFHERIVVAGRGAGEHQGRGIGLVDRRVGGGEERCVLRRRRPARARSPSRPARSRSPRRRPSRAHARRASRGRDRSPPGRAEGRSGSVEPFAHCGAPTHDGDDLDAAELGDRRVLLEARERTRVPAARAVRLELVPAQERAHPRGAERAHRVGGLGRVLTPIGLIPTSAAGTAAGEAAITAVATETTMAASVQRRSMSTRHIGRRRRVLKCRRQTALDGYTSAVRRPGARAAPGRAGARAGPRPRRSAGPARARARRRRSRPPTRSVRASACA